MKRLLAPMLALLLTACGIGLPPADGSTWTTTAAGITATWRWVQPGSLGANIIGRAQWWPGCDIGLDARLRAGGEMENTLPFVAAHELGHCLQRTYSIPGISRPDLREYARDPKEGWADTYASAYLASCGNSVEPLWRGDPCAPDPRTVYANYKEGKP